MTTIPIRPKDVGAVVSCGDADVLNLDGAAGVKKITYANLKTQLVGGITGQMVFKGTIAGVSVPATSAAAGDYYVISAAGSSNGKAWEVGDQAIYRGSSGQWDRIRGGRQVVNILDFGAVGDGVVDDTAAIQAAFDSVAADATIVVPRGTFAVTNVILEDKANVVLQGMGGVLSLRGTGAGLNYAGLQLRGALEDVTIHGMKITGDGLVVSNHGGIWTNGDIAFSNLIIERCKIRNVVVGIVISGLAADSVMGTRIQDNTLENLVGTNPGQGYGIASSLGGQQHVNNMILRNIVTRAQRHSIYWSVGHGGVIAENIVIEHRHGIASPGFSLGAITVIRSGFVTVGLNRIYRHNDTGIEIGSDAGESCSNVTVVGNVFNAVQGNYTDIQVGQGDPATTGFPTQINIVGNTLARSGGPYRAPIEIFCGKDLVISGNTCQITGAGGRTGMVQFIPQGEGAGTANYTDRVTIQGNAGNIVTASGSPYAVIFDEAASVSAIAVRMNGNHFGGVEQFVRFLAAQTNPNVSFCDNDASGWLASVGGESQFGSLAASGHLSAVSEVRSNIGFKCRAGTAVGGQPHFWWQSAAGLHRIADGLIDAEIGGNSGANRAIWAYGDDGTFMGTIMKLYRATLKMELGGTLLFNERDTPASPGAGQADVFLRDNGSGKSQLCVKFASGVVTALATDP